MNIKKFITLILIVSLYVNSVTAMPEEGSVANIPLSDLIEEIKDKTIRIAFSTQKKIQDQLDTLGIKEGEHYNLDSEIFKTTFKSIISDLWVALILSAQIKDAGKESFYAKEVKEYKDTLISSAQEIITENARNFAKFIKKVLTIRKKLEKEPSINFKDDREYLSDIKKLLKKRVILILTITKKLLIEKFKLSETNANRLIATRIKPDLGESVKELSEYITNVFLDYYTSLWKNDSSLRDALLDQPERLKGRNVFDGSIDSVLHVFESYIQYIYLPRVSFPFEKKMKEEEKRKIKERLEERARKGTTAEIEIPTNLTIEELRKRISDNLLLNAQKIESVRAERMREIQGLTFPSREAIKETLTESLKHRAQDKLRQDLVQLSTKLVELRNKMQQLQSKLEILITHLQ